MRVRVKNKPRKPKRGKKKKKSKKAKKKKRKARIKLVWKKVPRRFYVDVPKLGKDGKVMTDSKGPMFTRQWGEYSCYHIAHQEAWKRHLHKQQAELVTQVDEATKKAEKEARKRRRKKKSKKVKKG